MPGLFGIIRKDRSLPAGSLQAMARRMADSMRHTPWLRAELWGDEVFWGGRVHFGGPPPAELPVTGSGHVRVWLQGQLYLKGGAITGGRGEEGLSRLISEPASVLREADGSFNLAAYNTLRHDLIIATDRLGFRPLFWTETAEWFAYASEVKALLAVSPRQPDLDEVSLRQFFGFDHMLGDRTWWKGITLVPPASCWHISSQDSQRRRYWTFDEIHRDLRDEREVREQFASLWTEEVRRYSRPGTLPLLLSGGQDSRFLLAELRAQQADVVAITVGSPVSIEIGPARQAAQVAGVVHRLIHLDPDNWWHRREEAIWLTDGLVSSIHGNFAAAMDEVHTGNCYLPMNVIGDLLFGGSHLRKELFTVDWKRSPAHLLGPRFAENPFFQRDEVLEMSTPDALSYAGGPSSDCFHIRQRIRRLNLTSHHCLAAHCEFGFPGTGIALLELFLGALSDEQRRGHRFYNKFLLAHYPRYFASIPWQASRRGLRESFARRMYWRVRQGAYRRLTGRVWRPKPVRADQWFVDYPECLRRSRIRERLAQEDLLADEFLKGAGRRVLADQHNIPLSSQVLLAIVTFENYLRQVAGMPSVQLVPAGLTGTRAG